MGKTACIILAAGKGKRMGSALPKPLIELNGKPFIKHLLDSVKASGVCETPVIVVGNQAELVKQTLGSDYAYVEQTEQLGTGHAVKVCREALEGKVDSVIVLYADHPLVDAKTITSLAALKHTENTVLGMATITVPDFEGWRAAMYSFGRILRDESGNVTEIVEKKDATNEQLQVREVNPALFYFDAAWLWNNLETVQNKNAQGEYYLTDLVKIACEQHHPIATVDAPIEAAFGINTKEELALAEEYVQQRS